MESDIEQWIIERLSVELEEFNNLPACPFAKEAWVRGRVQCVHLQANKFPRLTISEYFRAELENFSYHWPKNKEVIVLGTEPENILIEQLSAVTQDANDTFLKDRGYLALEDHPTDIERVAGYIVNQGTYALILLQPKQKILDARKILQKKNYYKNWDEEYLKSVTVDRS